jgi:hypothetical protein
MGAALRGDGHPKLLAAGIAFGAIDFVIVGAMLFGAWLRLRRGERLVPFSAVARSLP